MTSHQAQALHEALHALSNRQSCLEICFYNPDGTETRAVEKRDTEIVITVARFLQADDVPPVNPRIERHTHHAAFATAYGLQAAAKR